ncbi:unnamed protein product, partial [Rotaria socialis]
FNFTLKILVLFEIENRNQFQIQNRTSKFAIAIASEYNFHKTIMIFILLVKKRIQNLIVKTNSKSNCKNKFKIIDSGNTITNRRTRLDANKVNQLLFIRRKLLTLREIFPPTIEQA